MNRRRQSERDGRQWRAPVVAALGGLMIMTGVLTGGCAHGGALLTAPGTDYRAALAATGPAGVPALAPGSAAEKAALDRVMAMFTEFSTSNVTALVRSVYAQDAYLRDGFKELRGREAIAPYMIRSTEPLRRCTFDFEDVSSRNGEYYLRWVMHVNLRRDPADRVGSAIGMSHMRFNAAGEVVFQQDYWDPSDILYSRIPVAGWLINKVKASL